MIIETASKIKLFLVKSQEPKREHKKDSYKTLTSKANVKKELTELDQEAQELINQILNTVADEFR